MRVGFAFGIEEPVGVRRWDDDLLAVLSAVDLLDVEDADAQRAPVAEIDVVGVFVGDAVALGDEADLRAVDAAPFDAREDDRRLDGGLAFADVFAAEDGRVVG